MKNLAISSSTLVSVSDEHQSHLATKLARALETNTQTRRFLDRHDPPLAVLCDVASLCCTFAAHLTEKCKIDSIKKKSLIACTSRKAIYDAPERCKQSDSVWRERAAPIVVMIRWPIKVYIFLFLSLWLSFRAHVFQRYLYGRVSLLR